MLPIERSLSQGYVTFKVIKNKAGNMSRGRTRHIKLFYFKARTILAYDFHRPAEDRVTVDISVKTAMRLNADYMFF